MPEWNRIRTITEAKEVASKRDKITAQYPRFQSLWDGVTFLIANNAEGLGISKAVDGTQYRLYVAESISEDFPDLAILYTVDADSVHIESMEINIGKESAESGAVA